MPTEAAERLRLLGSDLERVVRDHARTLAKEPQILKPLFEATEAARNRYKAVTEDEK